MNLKDQHPDTSVQILGGLLLALCMAIGVPALVYLVSVIRSLFQLIG